MKNFDKEPENEMEEPKIDFVKTEANRQQAIAELTRPDRKWVQKGYSIICTNAHSPYSLYIGNKQELAGVDSKGNPILKDIGKKMN